MMLMLLVLLVAGAGNSNAMAEPTSPEAKNAGVQCLVNGSSLVNLYNGSSCTVGPLPTGTSVTIYLRNQNNLRRARVTSTIVPGSGAPEVDCSFDRIIQPGSAEYISSCRPGVRTFTITNVSMHEGFQPTVQYNITSMSPSSGKSKPE
jgi:hypothetical protein